MEMRKARKHVFPILECDANRMGRFSNVSGSYTRYAFREAVCITVATRNADKSFSTLVFLFCIL